MVAGEVPRHLQKTDVSRKSTPKCSNMALQCGNEKKKKSLWMNSIVDQLWINSWYSEHTHTHTHSYEYLYIFSDVQGCRGSSEWQLKSGVEHNWITQQPVMNLPALSPGVCLERSSVTLKVWLCVHILFFNQLFIWACCTLNHPVMSDKRWWSHLFRGLLIH